MPVIPKDAKRGQLPIPAGFSEAEWMSGALQAEAEGGGPVSALPETPWKSHADADDWLDGYEETHESGETRESWEGLNLAEKHAVAVELEENRE
jgi:hypothetical protein